jgi:hypothetical protein
MMVGWADMVKSSRQKALNVRQNLSAKPRAADGQRQLRAGGDLKCGYRRAIEAYNSRKCRGLAGDFPD